MGPFPRSQGGYHFLFVVVEKFTKWTEVEAVHTIPTRAAVKFIRGIVCRFGVPNCIITDNGSQFTSGLFRAYCKTLGTKLCLASVAHPQSNGQAERANVEVVKGLMTRSFNRLKGYGKGWINELPSVLWSIRTNSTKPTGETLFALVYGAESVLPTEIKHGSARVLAFTEDDREDLHNDDLLLLDGLRRRAALRAAK